MSISIVGKKQKIISPVVYANGEDILSLEMEMQAGDVPHCSIAMRPEQIGKLGEFGDRVVITIDSPSFSGNFFDGIIVGDSISHTSGNVTYRVDLSHKDAFDLDSSSVMVPGFIPGSAVDSKALIKITKSDERLANSQSPSSHAIKSGNFWEKVREALLKHINKFAPMESATKLEKPGQLDMVTNVLNKMESWTGNWSMGAVALGGVSNDFSQSLRSGSTSSTFWNFLARFLSQYDLCIYCNPVGGMAVMPMYTGIRGDKIEIEPDHVSSISHGSQYNRTPERIVVMVIDCEALRTQGGTPRTNEVGEYKLDTPEKGACGTMNVELPHFLKNITSDKSTMKGFGMQYARMIACRTVSTLSTMSMSCPWIPKAVPGVPVKINYEALLKPYIGSKESSIQKYDGYCTSVRHMINTNSPPLTTLSFSHITKNAKHKVDKHPLWPEGQYKIDWK